MSKANNSRFLEELSKKLKEVLAINSEIIKILKNENGVAVTTPKPTEMTSEDG